LCLAPRKNEGLPHKRNSAANRIASIPRCVVRGPPDGLGEEDSKVWREPGMQPTPILARGSAFAV
jgi:hypothetical protein